MEILSDGNYNNNDLKLNRSVKDISRAMDRAEEFLINALYSNGSSTFFGFAYAIFYFLKQLISSETLVVTEMTSEMNN